MIGMTRIKGNAVVKRITDAGTEAMFVRAECADETGVKAACKDDPRLGPCGHPGEYGGRFQSITRRCEDVRRRMHAQLGLERDRESS